MEYAPGKKASHSILGMVATADLRDAILTLLSIEDVHRIMWALRESFLLWLLRKYHFTPIYNSNSEIVNFEEK